MVQQRSGGGMVRKMGGGAAQFWRALLSSCLFKDIFSDPNFTNNKAAPWNSICLLLYQMVYILNKYKIWKQIVFSITRKANSYCRHLLKLLWRAELVSTSKKGRCETRKRTTDLPGNCVYCWQRFTRTWCTGTVLSKAAWALLSTRMLLMTSSCWVTKMDLAALLWRSCQKPKDAELTRL